MLGGGGAGRALEEKLLERGRAGGEEGDKKSAQWRADITSRPPTPKEEHPKSRKE